MFALWGLGSIIFWKIAFQVLLGFAPNLAACIVGGIVLVPILLCQSWAIGGVAGATGSRALAIGAGVSGGALAALWMWLNVQGFDPGFAEQIEWRDSFYGNTYERGDLLMFLTISAIPAVIKGLVTEWLLARDVRL